MEKRKRDLQMVMASAEKSQPKTLKRGAGAAKATAGRAGKALRKEKQVKKQASTMREKFMMKNRDARTCVAQIKK